MKTVILALALLAALTGLADTAQATCYTDSHTIDPIEKDTGTALDKVKVTYEDMHCPPPPPD